MAEKRPDRTLGPGHDEFWGWCAKQELRLQKCTSCGGINWPVRTTCEFCGHKEFDWARMSGKGKLVSWCSFQQDYYHVMPVPYDCVLVELDEGVLFLSNPSGFANADAALGEPVAVAFLDCEDSAGAFKLPVFERA